MYDAMVDVSTVEPTSERRVSLSAPSLDLLLHKWLSELLFITDVEGLVFSEFAVEVDPWGEPSVDARVRGEPLDPRRHRIKTGLKAVTYHDLSVRREGETWVARVTIDV